MINIRKRGNVYQYCFEAGKVNGKRFYDLRGSFATTSLRNGCEIKDIAEVLGHKRIETTEKYYISSTEKNKKEVIKSLENCLKFKMILNS